jgi:hypothetical protein
MDLNDEVFVDVEPQRAVAFESDKAWCDFARFTKSGVFVNYDRKYFYDLNDKSLGVAFKMSLFLYRYIYS